jgi:hypothetical protein
MVVPPVCHLVVHHLILINSWDHRVLQILVPMDRRPECILPCRHTALWDLTDLWGLTDLLLVPWVPIVRLHSWTEWIRDSDQLVVQYLCPSQIIEFTR